MHSPPGFISNYRIRRTWIPSDKESWCIVIMWTNVFRIGGLQHISWFQLLPCESELNSLPEKSVRVEHKDAATFLVLSSHMQLQNDGFLSAWTNSFVGPWDPSQGKHNPDEKIKLWLFLPGRHMSIVETAQAAVSRLRVVGAGHWVAPGDSEEVAAALSHALRNCIERALRGLSYVRFGDVFSRCQSFAQSEKHFRRVQLVCEFIFAATEEAIFVHAIISSKRIRMLSSDDMERVLRYHNSNNFEGRLPVIVAPHGMRGRLTGCCPSDLVKQVYCSKLKASGGTTVLGIPFHVAQSSGCKLWGQDCYAEVSLGCPIFGSEKALQPNPKSQRNITRHDPAEPFEVAHGRGKRKQGSTHNFLVLGRTFIYPAEAVLVPLVQTVFARSSLARFWLHDWIGSSLVETWPFSDFSSSFMHRSMFGSTGNIEDFDSSWVESNGVLPQYSYNSSNNSNTSSISSLSSTCSDSNGGMVGDLEADADSLTCRQSGLSSIDLFENVAHKAVSKRARMETAESFGQAGMVVSARKGHDSSSLAFGGVQDGRIIQEEAYKSEYSAIEANTASVTVVATNDQVGTQWGWDDDEREMGMDIQTLLSEFGDFGDFFENDVLTFGEPPGTAESQALMFSLADCGDITGGTATGPMDIPDPMLLPVLDCPSFDGFNQPPPEIEEANSMNQELTKDVNSSSIPSTGEFDYLSKAEAVMMFAPEYSAVEISASNLSTFLRSSYVPSSHRIEGSQLSTNAYMYGATPPSPCMEVSDLKADKSARVKYYRHVQSGRKQLEKRCPADNSRLFCSVEPPFSSSNAPISLQMKKMESSLEPGQFLMSLKTVLATEIECLMLQAAMCRIRHMPLSCTNLVPLGMSRLTASTVSDQAPCDTSSLPSKISSNFEAKEIIPVRIAGDVDGGMRDGHRSAPVGVWRSVGVPKVLKQSSSPNIESSLSLPSNSFDEEGSVTYGQQLSLQDLLDAMALLVQQSTSFVDISLDADGGDDPFGWLAFQEQQRRGFSCGPSMVHAGCGGILATCHSLDNAGVELLDPLSADVHASSVISLLQSDIKVALKSAFGDKNMAGPLSVGDWCKGNCQLGDSGITLDGYSAECAVSEAKDSSSTATLAVGEPVSPPQSSTGGASCFKVSVSTDGARLDESCQRRSSQEICSSELELQMRYSRFRPSLMVLPMPAILVGYQDDWLKTSASTLHLWEKAPLEPYALPKPMTYYVVCPDTDPLSSAAADFFQQLGTVYETCRLGTHSPQIIGSQTGLASGKWSSSGFVFVDCPPSMKITSSSPCFMGSINDYLQALAKGWDVRVFLKSLAKVLKALRLGSNLTMNPKEGGGAPCTVIYVICPFPDSAAVLQTVVESCTALGSSALSSDKEKRSLLHSQVGKALSWSASADETSISNVPTLSGFSIPKLVVQIVTVETILKVSRPPVNELVILKEIAFTVYNKARRIPRSTPNDMVQSSTVLGRPRSALMHMSSPVPGLWKDCVAPRNTGPTLSRDGGLDASLRPISWDSSWQQTSRPSESSGDLSGTGDLSQEDVHYMFEPLFVLAEPSTLEHGISPTMLNASESLRAGTDDSSGGYNIQTSTSSGGGDIGSSSSFVEGSEPDGLGSGNQKVASLHCCYGWTEDWRWLVCIWTDSRGELLDSHIFPFGGISSRQDTKGVQSLFIQVLQQGCQILSSSASEISNIKPRDIVITRIGCFYELECQEWQKAIFLIGGNEVKKWPLQLRRSVPECVSASSNGTSLQQQELSLIQERNLPSSPNPLYGSHSKPSSFMKGSLAQTNPRKQVLAGHSTVDIPRGAFQWVESISLVSVSIDHSLHLIFPAETSSLGGGSQGSGSLAGGMSSYLEGFAPVKTLGSMSASYVLIPSSGMRFLPPMPLQLPICLTAESPPLAHLLHSKGFAIPCSTGFVVSKAVPSIRKDFTRNARDEWPCVLSVSLVDYYGGSSSAQEKIGRASGSKLIRGLGSDTRDAELETHQILESVAAELHALSWMTASPAFLARRTGLPFHCDMVQRLRRLLHYADRELCQREKAREV